WQKCLLTFWPASNPWTTRPCQLNLVLHFAFRFHHNYAGTDRFRQFQDGSQISQVETVADCPLHSNARALPRNPIVRDHPQCGCPVINLISPMTQDRVAPDHLTGHADFLVCIAVRVGQYVTDGLLFAARQKQNHQNQERPAVMSKSFPHGPTSSSFSTLALEGGPRIRILHDQLGLDQPCLPRLRAL